MNGVIYGREVRNGFLRNDKQKDGRAIGRQDLSITHKLTPIMMPSCMSVSLDSPLQMTVFPGGGSWARAR